ncbi:MAG TPA: hypothetical protein VGM95_00025 [Lactobacillaceae bacterium]|jgi:hypothetical protein
MANMRNASASRVDAETAFTSRFGTAQVVNLTNVDNVMKKFAYQDGQRTDNVNGYAITVHFMGKGEIDVKLPVTYEHKVKEMEMVRLVKPKLYEIDRRIYVSADDVVPVKKAGETNVN